MTYRHIVNEQQAQAYFRSLRERGVETIAMDFEGEYNLHQYGEKLCLIQIFDGQELAIIDPFPFETAQIKQIMENGAIMKVMYDSLSDQALLQKTYGSRINSILDLRPATDLLEFEKRDLGSVLEATLGIRIEKKKRFQRYNWTRRPIEDDAMEYALSDVLHLLELKDAILKRLLEQGAMDAFLLRNFLIQTKDFSGDRRPRIFKSGEFLRLPKDGKRLFEQVYDVRDRHARALDVPPDVVLNKQQMFGLAAGQIAPDDLEVNRRIPAATRIQFIDDLRNLL